MNEIARVDKNLSVERTPEVIALEINSITETVRKIFLLNSIEIGRRLAEAKTMLGHGEWGDWLKKSFNYSQRTASNLMGIFEQYGSSQMVIFCDNAKSQALANLSYTQAVLLMGIPMDEREAFIEEHDVENLSTRELQQAIKEKQELEAKLKEAESNKQVTESVLRTTEDVVKKLQNDLQIEKEESKKEIERLGTSISETKRLLAEAEASGLNNDEVERLEKSLDETQSELASSLSKIADLELQLKSEAIEVTAAPVIENIPEEVERELNELRERNKELEAKGSQPINTAPIKFKLHFDSLVKGFGELLTVLDEIDADTRDKYKTAVKSLIGKMSERL